jgi:hypothetical protein
MRPELLLLLAMAVLALIVLAIYAIPLGASRLPARNILLGFCGLSSHRRA